MALNRIFVEPMTGIEPAYSAWEAASAHPRSFASLRNPPKVGTSPQLSVGSHPISDELVEACDLAG